MSLYVRSRGPRGTGSCARPEPPGSGPSAGRSSAGLGAGDGGTVRRVAVSRFEVAGYRSLQDVSLDLAPLTVVVGANGSGKSNLYRALQLVHSCGTGQLARRIALEGGMPSILWAGHRQGEPKIDLSVRLDDLTYEIRLATAARGNWKSRSASLSTRSSPRNTSTATSTIDPPPRCSNATGPRRFSVTTKAGG